jgi:hypothetical protein
MPIKIHKDSHVDHDIDPPVMHFVLRQFEYRTEFFIETVEYPASYETLCSLSGYPKTHIVSLAPVPCALHLDVPEDEVHYARRGDRAWESRLCEREPRFVRQVTIVAGPHPDDPDAGMVLFTMYGGPAAPREPGDPSLEGEALAEAKRFWTKAALSE